MIKNLIKKIKNNKINEKVIMIEKININKEKEEELYKNIKSKEFLSEFKKKEIRILSLTKNIENEKINKNNDIILITEYLNHESQLLSKNILNFDQQNHNYNNFDSLFSVFYFSKKSQKFQILMFSKCF
jgi:hypothetical protein